MYSLVPLAFTGFIGGVAWRSLYDFGWAFILFVALLAGILYLFRLRKVVTSAWTISLIVVLLSFTLGVARMHVSVSTFLVSPQVGSEVSFTGVVVREPDVRDRYTNLIVTSDDFDHKILVRASAYETFKYADTLEIRGMLEEPENFEGTEGRIFNYRGYLAKDDIYYLLTPTKVVVRAERTTSTGILLVVKQKYLDALKRTLPEPSAALAGGITVGERRSLGVELTQDFRDTGLIHIVVLSGYNVSIIVIAVLSILIFLPQRLRYSIAIIFIVLFTVLVGASATTVRAALMGGIAAIGVMAHRNYDALHALIIAGFAMLLWNPYLLLYDPSFQLSFVATLGLLLGTPLLSAHLSFLSEKGGLRELVAATIATQIAVLPLLVYMMGNVSLVALPVNILVLPVLPLAMLLVFIVGVVGMVSATFALPIIFLAHGVLVYVVELVEMFASLPFATMNISAFPFWVVVVVYLFLGAGYLWKEKATQHIKC